MEKIVKISIFLAIATTLFYESTAFTSQASYYQTSGTSECFGSVDKGPLVGLLSKDRFDNTTSCGSQWTVHCTSTKSCIPSSTITVTIVGACVPDQCPAGDGLGSISLSKEAFFKIGKPSAQVIPIDLVQN